MADRPKPGAILLAVTVGLVGGAPQGEAQQFDPNASPPEEMRLLDFMVGEWVVEGAFRTPDHVGSDRTLWYTTLGGGLTRFDGQSWTAFTPGASAAADSIQSLIAERADPYAFSTAMSVQIAQDGFLLVIDDCKTSGTTVVYYDTSTSEWVATSFHAATNNVGTSRALSAERPPEFEGRETDRRGERVWRRRYELHGPDHFTMHTDISFDEGVTWIDDQLVREVRRR